MSTPLHTLRCAHGLSRALLLWFALYLGVAVAAPWVRPQALTLACGASGGLKLVLASASSSAEATATPNAADPAAPDSGHTLDCPLCLTASAPLSVLGSAEPPAQPLAHALHPLTVARMAALLRSPALPRAPPALA